MDQDKLKSLGILAGTGFYEFPGLEDGKWKTIRTEYGEVDILEGGLGELKILFIPRHGKEHGVPPHKVNFRANVNAMQVSGVDAVIGVNSVGSLRKDIRPGSIVIPDDYISLYRVDTFHDDKAVHITPCLDEGLQQMLQYASRGLNMNARYGGVYFQTLGPRLETKAEIEMISNYAHVVGMNMGSEAALCQEAEIRFANISSVDNYANGIVDEPLDFKKILELSRENQENSRHLLVRMAEELQ